MKYMIDLSLLKHNRQYRRLYAGQFISAFGTMVTATALPYQIYHETHSVVLVGLLSLFQLLPLLVTALLGGVLADYYNRRTLLIGAEFLLSLGSLGLIYNSMHFHLVALFAIASAMAAITGLHRPALESMTQLVVHKNDYTKASILNAFKWSSSTIVAPMVAGLLIAHFNVTIALFVDFFSFFISLIFLSLLHDSRKFSDAPKESTWNSIKSGLRYAVSHQELAGSYLVDFLAMIFGMPQALFPAIAHQYGGPKTLGLLYSAPAVGAFVLSCFTGWTSEVKRHGAAIAWGAMIWGLAITLFGLTLNHLAWALFFLVLAGAADEVSAVFRHTLWNASIPASHRGRLAGIEMISYLSGPRLGDTEAGFVAAAFGITASVVSGGILCMIGVALSCYYLPKFWNYRESVDQNVPSR